MSTLEIHDLSWPDGSVALVVRGVVDDDTVEAFESELTSAIGIGRRQPVIDLTGCRLETAGLGALIRLQRRAAGQRQATPLVTPQPDVRLRRIVALTTMFRLHPTLDAALRSSGSAALASQGCDAVRFSRPMERVGMLA